MFDICRLLDGRWPCLKHLTLGNLYRPSFDDGNLFGRIADFVVAHKSLESLSLPRRMACPDEIRAYSSATFPCLRRFNGTMHQLSLETFSFLHKLVLFTGNEPSEDINSLDSLLSMPQLLSLDITISIRYNEFPCHRVLVNSPKLHHLGIITKNSISLTRFSVGFQSAKHLRTFKIAGPLFGEDLTRRATLIAKQSSSLQEIALVRWHEPQVCVYLVERDQDLVAHRLHLIKDGKTGKFGKKSQFRKPSVIKLIPDSIA